MAQAPNLLESPATVTFQCPEASNTVSPPPIPKDASTQSERRYSALGPRGSSKTSSDHTVPWLPITYKIKTQTSYVSIQGILHLGLSFQTGPSGPSEAGSHRTIGHVLPNGKDF